MKVVLLDPTGPEELALLSGLEPGVELVAPDSPDDAHHALP